MQKLSEVEYSKLELLFPDAVSILLGGSGGIACDSNERTDIFELCRRLQVSSSLDNPASRSSACQVEGKFLQGGAHLLNGLSEGANGAAT
jgi:hypothetical protein